MQIKCFYKICIKYIDNMVSETNLSGLLLIV